MSGFLSRLRSSADTLDIQERQRIVRLVVRDILVGDETIVIRHSIPLSSMTPSGDGGVQPKSAAPPAPGGRSYLLRSGSSSVRCSPTCSCTTRSTCGCIGAIRAFGSSDMLTMRSSIAGARRKPGRCWRPSGVDLQNAAWRFTLRRPGSSTARMTTGRGNTSISSSTSSATPSNLDVRRAGGGVSLSASCRRSATRPPQRYGKPFADGQRAAFQQCLDRRCAQCSDPVEACRLDVLGDARLGDHAAVAHQEVLSRLAPCRRGWQHGVNFPRIAAGRDDGGCLRWIAWAVAQGR